MKKVILLDVDGTLLDFDASAAIALKEAFGKKGYPYDESIFDRYEEINHRLWEQHEKGLLPRDRVLADRFVELFADLGIDDTDGAGFDDLFRDGLVANPILIGGAKELLDHLKQKYRLYVVTNGVASTQDQRMKKIGLAPYMDGVFISERIGAQKPQKEFFDYVFAHVPDCTPDEMILIGDSITADIAGADRAGIDSIWFNPRCFPNKVNARFNYEVRALSEIMEIL